MTGRRLPNQSVSSTANTADLSREKCRLSKRDQIQARTIKPSPKTLKSSLHELRRLALTTIQKINLNAHYLVGFASTFPNTAERSVWVEALGSVDISSQPHTSGGEMDEGEVSSFELFEASEDPAVVFEEAEHDLDFVAFFIKKPVGVTLD